MKKEKKEPMARLQITLPKEYVKAMDKKIRENPKAYRGYSAIIRFALDVMP